MNNIASRYSKEETQQITSVIRSQIAVPTFWTLGATDLGYMTTEAGNPAFVFIARIIPTGKQAPRKMSVAVEYLPSDLYKVTVHYLNRGGDRIAHFEQSEVYAEDLNGILFRLDREG